MGNRCIDAHQHLWRYLPPGPDWMGDGMEILRRDFLIDDLRAVTTEAGVTGTIVVETERTIAEAEWLRKVASSNDLIRGVVGWAPLTIPDEVGIDRPMKSCLPISMPCSKICCSLFQAR